MGDRGPGIGDRGSVGAVATDVAPKGSPEPPSPDHLSSPIPGPRSPVPSSHLLVLGGYLLLTLALTYPIARDLFTRVPGGGDAWQHIWNLWWVKHAVVDLHTN